jgi:RNA polymerase sigma-70 factor, ECF subfamily
MPGAGPVNIEDENDLLERARRLEEPALSAIFDQYYDLLFRYLYNHIGNQLTAEDLTSDVFRNLLEQLKQGRGPTKSLKAWLYRVAHNLMVDEIRRGKYRQHEMLDENQQTTDLHVGDQVQRSMEEQTMLRALSHLTEKQRDVISLKYMFGLENEEIAQVLSINIGTVKALQFRGLLALRRYLENAEGIDRDDV